MPKPKLTPEIKLQADAIVARFNVEQLRGQPWAHYVSISHMTCLDAATPPSKPRASC